MPSPYRQQLVSEANPLGIIAPPDLNGSARIALTQAIRLMPEPERLGLLLSRNLKLVRVEREYARLPRDRYSRWLISALSRQELEYWYEQDYNLSAEARRLRNQVSCGTLRVDPS
jgi:hypothetical protein